MSGMIGPRPLDWEGTYEDWLAYCVSQAPPLSQETIEHLARLLPPVCDWKIDPECEGLR